MPPFSQGEIVLLQLHSGAFIIGKFEESKLGLPAKLSRPRVLQLRPERNGSVQIGFVPMGFPLFEPHDSNMVPYPESQVLIAKKAPDDMQKGYLQSVSGLQLTGGPLPGLGG